MGAIQGCGYLFFADRPSTIGSVSGGISFIAGGIIVTLGSLAVFGPIGSTGFIVAMGAGGVLVCGGVGGVIYIAKQNSKDSEALREIRRLPQEFFENKSQVRAKQVFSEKMGGGIVVAYPKACQVDVNVIPNAALDQNVFHYSRTFGVQYDISVSSFHADCHHIYQVASQYNCSEAPDRFTPEVGRAMQTSEYDRTQGPLAQRTNPDAFESVNAYLTHLGFNMLNEVLPEGQTTYGQGSWVEHGYLCPKDDTIEDITRAFRENYHKAEYVCYKSLPIAGSNNPVSIFLQSAPAVARNYSVELNVETNTDELEKYAALANFLALFNYGIQYAEQNEGQGRAVVLHVAAVGLGAFGNKVENYEWGFKKAAQHFQGRMRELGIKVQLESYGDYSPLIALSERLNIPLRDRIE